jgi:hypothetical protein
MIEHQLEPIEVATRLDSFPSKQVRLFHGHLGGASSGVVSSTTMIPWWPPFFILANALGVDSSASAQAAYASH